MSRYTPEEKADVLIVGAGPTGLMMACQLAIHQVSFYIIDKNATQSQNSGALIVQARSLEIFERMGIAGEAVRGGIIANKVNIVNNGKRIASSEINNIGATLSQFPFLLMHEQSKTEQLLLKFLSDRGISVERGIRLKDFTEVDQAITSTLILPDGTERSIKTKYIIAADGAKSTIRDYLKIPFEGISYPNPVFILDCKAKTDLNPGEISFAFSASAVAGFFPLQGSRWRIDSILPRESERPVNTTIDSVEQKFHIWTKMNVTFQSYEWFSVTHCHQKYARSLRIRNCFLTGDAAHVNTPVGAQGMNTGLQDAFNLAWKLAYVIKQLAKPEILDTYPTERSGISRGFARYADTVFRLFTSNNEVVKFIRVYILMALVKVLFPLVEKRRKLRKLFFKSVSQIGIQYQNSFLSYRESEGTFSQGAPNSGDRLPYIDLFFNGKKTNSFEILDVTSFSLLVLANDVPSDIQKVSEIYKLKVIIISNMPETQKLYQRLGINNSGYFLIRPDMHIALRSAALHSGLLNNYLKRILVDHQ